MHLIAKAAIGIRNKLRTELAQAREANLNNVTNYQLQVEELTAELADALQATESWIREVTGRDADIDRLKVELATEKEARKKLEFIEQDWIDWAHKKEAEGENDK